MNQPQIPNEFTGHAASKQNILVRAFFDGTQWAGKTFSALAFATGICLPGKTICVIDTESESSNDYADHFVYDVISLNAPYSPDRYQQAIAAALQQYDVGVLIIDSISHEWEGAGGILEAKHIHEQQYMAQKGKTADSYYMWREYTMLHNKFIEYLIHLPVHLIQTCRTKPHYEIIAGKRQKVGADIKQREGIEFEQNIHLSFDAASHAIAMVEKDRYGIFTAGELVSKEHGLKLIESFKGSPAVKPATPTPQPVPENWAKYLEHYSDCPVKTHPDELKVASSDWHEHWLRTNETWSIPPPENQPEPEQKPEPTQVTKEVIPPADPEPVPQPTPAQPASPPTPPRLWEEYRKVPAHGGCPNVYHPDQLNCEEYKDWHTHWLAWQAAESHRRKNTKVEFPKILEPDGPAASVPPRGQSEAEFKHAVPGVKDRRALSSEYFRVNRLKGKTTTLSDAGYAHMVHWCKVKAGEGRQRQEMADREEKPKNHAGPQLKDEPEPEPKEPGLIPNIQKDIVNHMPNRAQLEQAFRDWTSIRPADEPVSALRWDHLNQSELASFEDYVATIITERPERQKLIASLQEYESTGTVTGTEMVDLWQGWNDKYDAPIMFRGYSDERIDMDYLKAFLAHVAVETSTIGGGNSSGGDVAKK